MRKILIIPAAGEGNRLSKYYFPKCLLPYKEKAIINKIVQFWDADEVYIVANEENAEQIVNYMHLSPVNVIVTGKVGSANAVWEALRVSKRSLEDEFVVNWCDVVPKSYPSDIFPSILSDPNNKCRFNGKLGGFYGVFMFKGSHLYSEVKEPNGEEDFIHCIDLKAFNEEYISSADIGDDEKYTTDKRSCVTPIRRGMELNASYVIKPNADVEFSWFSDMSELIPGLPKPVWKRNSMVMDRIEGSHDHDRIVPLLDIAKEIRECMSPMNANRQDCCSMYINKTVSRLNEIDYLFPKEFTVNGVKCSYIKEKILNIEAPVPDFFTPIHGDLTTFNVIWNGNKHTLIDPRGMFGGTYLFGDPRYDISKIVYSYQGWPKVNQGTVVANRVGDNDFVVHDPDFPEFIKNYGEREIKLITATIWLSATGYLKDNVISAFYAYLTGSLILQKWVKEYGNAR